jgi:predicted Zn-dependent protease
MKTQLKILLILIAIIGSGYAGATKKAEPAETPKLTLGETVIKDLKSDWEYESAQKPEDCFKSVDKWKKTKKLESGAEACSTCIKSKQFERAEEVAQELSKRELSYPWGPYFLAVLARTKGQTERALWLTELAQKRGESIGLIHYLRGQILWDQKQYDAAVVAIEKSVATMKPLTEKEFTTLEELMTALVSCKPRVPFYVVSFDGQTLSIDHPYAY